MKNIQIILTLVALVISSLAFGQTKCDTIYNAVEKIPQYDKGMEGLRNYLNEELVPIIINCMKGDSVLITSLYIVLTIDKEGSVIDAKFTRPLLTDQCKSDLNAKLLTMTGWTPGQLYGQNVCYRLIWPISCLKWDDYWLP